MNEAASLLINHIYGLPVKVFLNFCVLGTEFVMFSGDSGGGYILPTNGKFFHFTLDKMGISVILLFERVLSCILGPRATSDSESNKQNTFFILY